MRGSAHSSRTSTRVPHTWAGLEAYSQLSSMQAATPRAHFQALWVAYLCDTMHLIVAVPHIPTQLEPRIRAAQHIRKLRIAAHFHAI